MSSQDVPTLSPQDRFASIARRYDLANSILSAGLHHRWKREAVAAAMLRPGDSVLDVGAGTGDLTRLAVASGCTATGVDVSWEMLELARLKLGGHARFHLVVADMERLPFRAGTFDAVLTGFALRHPTNLRAALQEFQRVLRAAGRLVILEFSRPVSPLVSVAYNLYSSTLIPALGGWLTGDRDAYEYLVASIRRFPDQRTLAVLLNRLGFEGVSYRNLSGGIVALHTAFKSLA